MKAKPPSMGGKDILIAVMGMTGSGKTSFIQEITGIEMVVGHGLEACTKEIHVATARIEGHVVHFIDTPGFDDTDLKDSDILMTIATYLGGSHHKDVRLSGILYLHRIIDPRVGGAAIKNLNLFRKLVGERNMGNVVLLTTMWGLVSRQDGENRLNELIATGKFWGGMIASGATYDCYQGTQIDAYRIVKLILRNAPIVLQIQEELAKGTSLEHTSAGREVNERLVQLQEQHTKEIAAMKEEIHKASQTKDVGVLKELHKHYETLIREQRRTATAQEQMQQAKLDKVQSRLKKLEILSESSCVIC